jgi:O-antigen ligase
MPPSRKLSNLMKYTIVYLYAIGILYPILNLGGSYIGIPGVVFQVVFVTFVLVAFFYTIRWDAPPQVLIIFFVALPFIGFNIYYSIDFMGSLLYWMLWLCFIFAIFKTIKVMHPADFRALMSHVPFMLLTTSLVLFAVLFSRINESLPTKNSLGILSAAALISCLVIENKSVKLVCIIISLVILNMSDSRSSFFFALAVIGFYQVLKFSSKHIGLYIISLLLLSFSFSTIFEFVEQKMVQKEYQATNLQDAISSASRERTLLLEKGWEVFLDRPMFGYGIKTKYQEGRISIVKGHDMGVHNGYLGALIEVGLFLSLFIVLGLIKILSRSFKIIINKKANIWVMLVLFGLIRAYGENYLFFNLGNLFSIIFILLCAILLSRPNLLLESSYSRNEIIK